MFDFFSAVRRWAGFIRERDPADNRVPIHNRDADFIQSQSFLGQDIRLGPVQKRVEISTQFTRLIPSQPLADQNIRMEAVQRVQLIDARFTLVGQAYSAENTVFHPN